MCPEAVSLSKLPDFMLLIHPFRLMPAFRLPCPGHRIGRMVPGTLFTALLVSVILPVSFAQSNTPDAATWVTNGNVNSIAANGSTVYLGGAFTHVGPLVPYGIALSTTDTTVCRTRLTQNPTARCWRSRPTAAEDGTSGGISLPSEG